MTSNACAGVRYEPLDMELQDRSRPSSRSGLEPNGASSHISVLAGTPSLDDDQRSLLVHQESSEFPVALKNAGGDVKKLTTASRKKRYRFKSWKVGVLTAAVMTATVLLVNSILIIWASVEFGLENGIGTAYEGSCDAVNSWSFWLHIVINILSTMLLSASNYTMQCVTAPTRTECDRAHSRGDWLDIGIPSIRNLFKIKWQRRIMWALLTVSSTPIHLLYNSAVFKTLDDNRYNSYLVGRKFLNSEYTFPSAEEWPLGYVQFGDLDSVRTRYDNIRETYLSNPSSFDNITTELCIERYATYYLSGFGHVILITDDTTTQRNPTQPEGDLSDNPEDGYSPFKWMCEKEGCTSIAEARALSNSAWVLNGSTIDYCMSQTQKEHCKLQFSAYIMVAVLICNAIKCATMLWVILHQRETTFVTFGDAIASWLDIPDAATAGRCSTDARNVVQALDGQRSPEPQPIILTGRRWRLGVSKKRWITTLSLLTAAVLASCTAFGMTTGMMKRATTDTIFSLGFGAVNLNMLYGWRAEGAEALVYSVLFSNMPQVILSFAYLLFNALVTCMLLANEYSGYEVHRKLLRVTTPIGKQRTTYWLQLPYTYGAPVIAVSATLHWLVSQSIFLVRVDNYFEGKPDYTYGQGINSTSSVGLSPAPMLVVVVLGTGVIATAVAMGFRKLEGDAMPVARSCSFVLAAAAHRPVGDVDAAVLPVKWGEVIQADDNAGIGHCCLTSEHVTGVKLGKKYK